MGLPKVTAYQFTILTFSRKQQNPESLQRIGHSPKVLNRLKKKKNRNMNTLKEKAIKGISWCWPNININKQGLKPHLIIIKGIDAEIK